ncbi:hypothetical protein PGB28_06485 [Primorskyibacter aestuariivivens]|uniref:hypothetical protein n=1 Tax=Primorskyibacter aestuariivivens TaxID=1888912 RepID=UPI002300D0DC|nr:hypothetical protein [Primorskyibacter aestuariivivens]MDA7428097.1 hypothetical protein [Primorskyibacter aestuariivivens]
MSLMRLFCLLALLATPAIAWEFSPTPICILRNDGNVATEVTYDGTLYAIHLTRADGWPTAPVFAIRFEGAAPLTISTSRHVIDGTTLTVTDRGFGNVLSGLQFNHTATALIGDLAVPIDLSGAADPVRAFRDCPGTPSV